MWKIVIGFVVFAVVALFILKKSGGNIDMGGESHGLDSPASQAESVASAPVLSAAPGPAAAAAASH